MPVEGAGALAPEGQTAAPVQRQMSVRLEPHMSALASVELPHGRISYYRKGDFAAKCFRHPGCFLTRTAKGGRRESQGRPCGLLAAWLDSDAATKVEHMRLARQLDCEVRRSHRLQLPSCIGGPELLAFERPCREDEDDEPIELP